jgi:hypothetical protein
MNGWVDWVMGDRWVEWLMDGLSGDYSFSYHHNLIIMFIIIIIIAIFII